VRRVFILLGIAVLLGVAGWFVALYVEKAEFERRVAAIRAAGQPTTPEELIPDPIPDDENAAVLLAEAHALLRRLNTDSDGAWLLLVRDEDEWDDEERAQVEKYFNDAAPYRALVARALARPDFDFGYPYEEGFHAYDPVILWIAETQEHYTWRVRLDRDPDGFAERVAARIGLMLDLADRIRPVSSLRALLRGTLRGVAGDLIRIARTHDGFDAALLRRLLDRRLARAEPPRGPPASLIDGERINRLICVDRWLDGRLDIAQLGSLRMTSPGNRRLLYRDANLMLEVFAQARAACDTTPDKAHRFEVEGPDDPVLYPLASSAAWSLPHLFRSYTQEVAVLRLTRVALAVLEHRQTTGRWPAALPDGLPLDPFSGTPFVYEGTATGVHIRAASPRPREELADWGLAWEFVD
jgi:hypothetical protein